MDDLIVSHSAENCYPLFLHSVLVQIAKSGLLDWEACPLNVLHPAGCDDQFRICRRNKVGEDQNLRTHKNGKLTKKSLPGHRKEPQIFFFRNGNKKDEIIAENLETLDRKWENSSEKE